MNNGFSLRFDTELDLYFTPSVTLQNEGNSYQCEKTLNLLTLKAALSASSGNHMSFSRK